MCVILVKLCLLLTLVILCIREHCTLQRGEQMDYLASLSHDAGDLRCIADDYNVTLYEKKCLAFIQKKTQWNNVNCSSLNGTLLEILDPKTMRFVSNQLYEFGSDWTEQVCVWIGATKAKSRDDYKWIWSGSGLSVDVPYWGHLQPNEEGDEKCACLKPDKKMIAWEWHDYNCEREFYAICQFDATPVPTTTTIMTTTMTTNTHLVSITEQVPMVACSDGKWMGIGFVIGASVELCIIMGAWLVCRVRRRRRPQKREAQSHSEKPTTPTNNVHLAQLISADPQIEVPKSSQEDCSNLYAKPMKRRTAAPENKHNEVGISLVDNELYEGYK